MDADSLLNHARWTILEAVSTKPGSTVELAQRIGTSAPNVSQQLRLLAAYGYIAAQRESIKGAGKPRQQYAVVKSCCEIAYAADGFAQRKRFTPSETQELLLRTLFVSKAEDQLFLIKALACTDELLDACAIVHLKSTSEAIELALITHNAEHVRTHYATILVECRGKARTIRSHVYTPPEARAHGDALRSGLLLHDPKHLLREVES